MSWDELKKYFSDFHAELISKEFLVNIIREYQFTNQIEVKNGRNHNKKILIRKS